MNISCAAAVPAFHTRRPVRLILDRDEDMHTSGHRHAFIGQYKVRAFDMLSTRCRPVATRSCLQRSAASQSRGVNGNALSSEAFGSITMWVHGRSQHPALFRAAPIFRVHAFAPKPWAWGLQPAQLLECHAVPCAAGRL